MRRGRGGNVILETAMWMPILFLLIVGTILFGVYPQPLWNAIKPQRANVALKTTLNR